MRKSTRWAGRMSRSPGRAVRRGQRPIDDVFAPVRDGGGSHRPSASSAAPAGGCGKPRDKQPGPAKKGYVPSGPLPIYSDYQEEMMRALGSQGRFA